jgi:hypothetical protein
MTHTLGDNAAFVHAMKTNVLLMEGGCEGASFHSLLTSALDGCECLGPCTPGVRQSTPFGRAQELNDKQV